MTIFGLAASVGVPVRVWGSVAASASRFLFWHLRCKALSPGSFHFPAHDGSDGVLNIAVAFPFGVDLFLQVLSCDCSSETTASFSSPLHVEGYRSFSSIFRGLAFLLFTSQLLLLTFGDPTAAFQDGVHLLFAIAAIAFQVEIRRTASLKVVEEKIKLTRSHSCSGFVGVNNGPGILGFERVELLLEPENLGLLR